MKKIEILIPEGVPVTDELEIENYDLNIELSDYPGEIGQLYLYIDELESENETLSSCCTSKVLEIIK